LFEFKFKYFQITNFFLNQRINFLEHDTKRQRKKEKEEIKVRIIALTRKFSWRKAWCKKERKKRELSSL